MEEFRIEISDVADPGDEGDLRDAILEFNFRVTGYRDGRSLSCFLRDGDRRLVAGIDGFSWGGYARVNYLWIAEHLRGQGLGSRLLDAAEEAARERGCTTVVLDSHSFQAPGFYVKRGYTEVGMTRDTPRGHTQTLFHKAL